MLLDILLQLQLPRGEAELDHGLCCQVWHTPFLLLCDCLFLSLSQAHYPASCSHMSRWVDDDGYYEGMTSEAQSKHLAKLISKHCPNCQAQIEKNEGCLQ